MFCAASLWAAEPSAYIPSDAEIAGYLSVQQLQQKGLSLERLKKLMGSEASSFEDFEDFFSSMAGDPVYSNANETGLSWNDRWYYYGIFTKPSPDEFEELAVLLAVTDSKKAAQFLKQVARENKTRIKNAGNYQTLQIENILLGWNEELFVLISSDHEETDLSQRMGRVMAQGSRRLTETPSFSKVLSTPHDAALWINPMTILAGTLEEMNEESNMSASMASFAAVSNYHIVLSLDFKMGKMECTMDMIDIGQKPQDFSASLKALDPAVLDWVSGTTLAALMTMGFNPNDEAYRNMKNDPAQRESYLEIKRMFRSYGVNADDFLAALGGDFSFFMSDIDWARMNFKMGAAISIRDQAALDRMIKGLLENKYLVKTREASVYTFQNGGSSRQGRRKNSNGETIYLVVRKGMVIVANETLKTDILKGNRPRFRLDAEIAEMVKVHPMVFYIDVAGMTRNIEESGTGDISAILALTRSTFRDMKLSIQVPESNVCRLLLEVDMANRQRNSLESLLEFAELLSGESSAQENGGMDDEEGEDAY